ncbi:hypothetical protein NE237_028841 [Protea cynaroides]|uniref:Uncharacterized protein n=1 Tax=Protea cynaroides TaxID=273540 RepID=A0A9Q0JT93_9MAGN|nr:hypothetical protein NE237_028841 [Protea cynaroides]
MSLKGEVVENGKDSSIINWDTVTQMQLANVVMEDPILEARARPPRTAQPSRRAQAVATATGAGTRSGEGTSRGIRRVTIAPWSSSNEEEYEDYGDYNEEGEGDDDDGGSEGNEGGDDDDHRDVDTAVPTREAPPSAGVAPASTHTREVPPAACTFRPPIATPSL